MLTPLAGNPWPLMQVPGPRWQPAARHSSSGAPELTSVLYLQSLTFTVFTVLMTLAVGAWPLVQVPGLPWQPAAWRAAAPQLLRR